MNNEFQISDKVVQYLNGELIGKDLSEFEELLKISSAVREELELEQLIRSSVIDFELLQWKEGIKSERKKQLKVSRVGKLISIVFLLTLSSSWLFIHLSNNDDVHEVYSNEAQKRPVNSFLVKNQQLKKPIVHSTLEVKEHKNIKEEILTKEIVDVENSLNVTTSDSLVVKLNEVEEPYISKIEEVEKSNKILPVPVLCDYSIFSNVTTQPTCEGRNTGKIIIDVQHGEGVAPYKFQVVGQPEWNQSNVISDLAGGYYRLAIQDANDCMTELTEEYFVEEKYCFTPEPGFNPDFETWEYQFESDFDYRIKIVSKRGVVIVNAEANSNFVWDGTDNQGNRVLPGLYWYEIKRNEELIKRGNVTVLY